MPVPRTLYDRIWDSHVIEDRGDGFALLYVDGHLIDEHTSAQAFDALRNSGRRVRRPAATLATVDHNAPLPERGDADPRSLLQIEALERNARSFGVPLFTIGDARQGISHIVGPEQGFILPGTTVACGDSHASTYGAFGAIGLGIGTTEIEHVLASQTLVTRRLKTLRVTLSGELAAGVAAKDVVLALVGRLGAGGATGHAIEYTGETVRLMSMEARMTLANMAIEAGAPAGLIAPDETTFSWLKGRPYAPRDSAWDKAVAFWRTLRSDEGARFDREVSLDVGALAPQVTWGTSPQDVIDVTGRVPESAARRSLDYMGLTAGQSIVGTTIDKVFIGSCTNGRLEDLRAAADVARGRRVADGVEALVVPGSGLVKVAAEAEGLDRIFREAGFGWRAPGCSMCLAMNADRLMPGQRCASTSNRNFEGRQGPGGRTHLMSPAMAAAAAISGRIVDVRGLMR
jgi:3-isopropylmalate/(R)-2-methylmalate dehydratase large subunit